MILVILETMETLEILVTLVTLMIMMPKIASHREASPLQCEPSMLYVINEQICCFRFACYFCKHFQRRRVQKVQNRIVNLHP